MSEITNLEIKFDKAMFRHRLLHWYGKTSRSLPWRDDFKRSNNPFYVWLSEVMLQQTVIKAVIPVYRRFLSEIDSIETLAKASEDDVRRLVRGLGYYRRFGLMKKAAQVLTSREPVAWPMTYEGWLALPGIGPYTAAAVSSIAFNAVAGVVDGNVERVLCRIFNIQKPPNDPLLKKQFTKIVNEMICASRPGCFNQALMEVGQLVCRPVAPLCAECPLAFSCEAKKLKTQHLAPASKVKIKFKDVSLKLIIVEEKDSILLYERPDTAKFLKRTAGFVTQICQGDTYAGDGFPLLPPLKSTAKFKSLGHIKHSITNHKIKAEVLVSRLAINPKQILHRLNKNEVESKLVSNLDRKAWQLYVRSNHEENKKTRLQNNPVNFDQ